MNDVWNRQVRPSNTHALMLIAGIAVMGVGIVRVLMHGTGCSR